MSVLSYIRMSVILYFCISERQCKVSFTILLLLRSPSSSSFFNLLHDPPCPPPSLDLLLVLLLRSLSWSSLSSSFNLLCNPPSISSAILLVLLRATTVSAVCSLITSPLVCFLRHRSSPFSSAGVTFICLQRNTACTSASSSPTIFPSATIFLVPAMTLQSPFFPSFSSSSCLLSFYPLSPYHTPHPALSHYIPITFILLSCPPLSKQSGEQMVAALHFTEPQKEGGGGGRELGTDLGI